MTGSTLRASYIAKYLSKAGHNVKFITPLRQLPLQSDFFFSFFVYTLKVIPERYDVVFVLKPYPNACIPALLEKNVDKNLRRKLRLENKHVIIYAAHLNIATDLEPIRHAFEFVSAEIRDCKLLVVGGGPRQRYYEKKVEGMGLQRNVIFTGYVDKELFPSYIALGDVCVVYYENKLANFYRTSMKLREYLAIKKRVACNDVGELKQFGEYTYQTISDVQDFANKIADVMISGGDKRELKGYKFVRQKYSWEKIIEEFERDVLVPLIGDENK